LTGLTLGRPDQLELVLPAASRAAPRDASRRVVTRDTEPKLKLSYKHSSIRRQYKTGDALRAEATINDARATSASAAGS
jgi:hypothetical protein